MSRESRGKRRRRETAILESLHSFLFTYRHIARFAGTNLRGEELAESLYQVEAEGRLVLLDLLGRAPTDDEVARCLTLEKLKPKTP